MADAVCAAHPFETLAASRFPGLAFTALPVVARLVLRGTAVVAQRIEGAFGVGLPRAINRAASSERRSALMLGPDEWLLLAEDEPAEDIAAMLGAALAGMPHSLVDVSHRQAAFVVEGRRAALVLAAGCPLDLRSEVFPVGMATRSHFAKAEIILWRTGDWQFHVEAWRSFASYMTGQMLAAEAGTADL